MLKRLITCAKKSNLALIPAALSSSMVSAAVALILYVSSEKRVNEADQKD